MCKSVNIIPMIIVILGLVLYNAESKVPKPVLNPVARMIHDRTFQPRRNHNRVYFGISPKEFHRIERPRKKKVFKKSELIFANEPKGPPGINITGLKPGDVILELVVTSPTVHLNRYDHVDGLHQDDQINQVDHTDHVDKIDLDHDHSHIIEDKVENSTQKNVVDWFLGIVGLRPPDNNNSGSGSEGGQQPSEGCEKCTCGLAVKHKRIVGGVETLVNEYPWMVALLYSNRFYCGASLINTRYLLTAAHCVNGFNKDRMSAVFLDHDRSNQFETMTFSRKIKTILRHNSYQTGGTFNNDIALLRLNEDVKMTHMMRPVCLPPTGKSFSGYEGIAVGWGATAQQGQISHKLREVTVPIMANSDCKKTGYNSRITDNMLCAGFPDGKKDSCQGDSGGPLHVVSGKYHEIVGIVSWGEGCAQPNYPGVYTRVNRFITWIKANTKDACYCNSF